MKLKSSRAIDVSGHIRRERHGFRRSIAVSRAGQWRMTTESIKSFLTNDRTRTGRAIGVNRVNWRRYAYLSNCRRHERNRWNVAGRVAGLMTTVAFSWNDGLRRSAAPIKCPRPYSFGNMPFRGSILRSLQRLPAKNADYFSVGTCLEIFAGHELNAIARANDKVASRPFVLLGGILVENDEAITNRFDR